MIARLDLLHGTTEVAEKWSPWNIAEEVLHIKSINGHVGQLRMMFRGWPAAAVIEDVRELGDLTGIVDSAPTSKEASAVSSEAAEKTQEDPPPMTAVAHERAPATVIPALQVVEGLGLEVGPEHTEPMGVGCAKTAIGQVR